MEDVILRMTGISKEFPGVKALDKVDFNVKRGEVHTLVGENGAGKSTLMKILYGIYKPDAGQIFIEGEQVILKSPLDAQKKGLSIIFQEFSLVDSLSIAENIFLGRLDVSRGKSIDWKKVYRKTQDLLSAIGYNLNPKMKVEDLGVAEKQMVEIAKALSYNANIIVMDEPSSALTENEINNLMNMIRNIKSTGVAIIYITHRLEEVFKISDRITVLRDGKVIDTVKTIHATRNKIIEKMVGRAIEFEFPARESHCGNIVLSVRNLNRAKILKDISFDLHYGEVLGIAGLVGSGRTELARAIFGADRIDSGEIRKNNQVISIKSVKDAIKNKIALVTEDRKSQGLSLKHSVAINISITNLNEICKSALLSQKEEEKVTKSMIEKLNICTPSDRQRVLNLSGGNQQKVVLAKWLFSESEIIIFDEPTRGIDVGAKFEIYKLMNTLTGQGKAIIMISSELPEVLSMSDRVILMYKGQIKGIFSKDELSPEKVIEYSV